MVKVVPAPINDIGGQRGINAEPIKPLNCHKEQLV
jgi:hypothetical protein